ncbi:unnamed protein product [Rotaria magnacalcarata]|uniref:Cytochrome c oxidase assembly protein COX20, mitochondrial n=3 Tax=Rotaria magnacalcarata TaxID=392030 RepID=A0A815JPC9_9BILA|nr:unnamed protein product [Rotaria magnacalcarata]CAF1571623.1 unnamed protein product [Rotaria magnacalcarata]CAF1928866.1 unnamed protein product [Rotaria magnacalcarata]CAF2032075.1 unnamed protein product [Rotaria magnacalcarata]CAF2079423.1 unnamed protein product [Rotaria magnacalcarata]
MAPPMDPSDFSKLRTVEPISSDPNIAPATTWEKFKQAFGMFIEVSKNRPISETVCLREALVLGIPGSFVCSMAAFLLTTNRSRVFQAAILSLPILSMGRFTQCRASKFHERKATILVSKMIRAKMLTDGTAKQAEFENLFKKSAVELSELERQLDEIISKQQTGAD